MRPPGDPSLSGDQTRRGGWETLQRNLAADAALADATVYAAGGRRLTVEHGQPLTPAATALVRQLVDDVDHACIDAGRVGGGGILVRSTSITWTFLPVDVPAQQLVAAARTAADRLNPGSWVITADQP